MPYRDGNFAGADITNIEENRGFLKIINKYFDLYRRLNA